MRFQNISEFYPTLKPHNFFAIRSILIILDVPESSGPLLSRNRVIFREGSTKGPQNVGLESEIVDFSVFSLKSLKCTRSENFDS